MTKKITFNQKMIFLVTQCHQIKGLPAIVGVAFCSFGALQITSPGLEWRGLGLFRLRKGTRDNRKKKFVVNLKQTIFPSGRIENLYWSKGGELLSQSWIKRQHEWSRSKTVNKRVGQVVWSFKGPSWATLWRFEVEDGHHVIYSPVYWHWMTHNKLTSKK